jgi:hypothetical protein
MAVPHCGRGYAVCPLSIPIFLVYTLALRQWLYWGSCYGGSTINQTFLRAGKPISWLVSNMLKGIRPSREQLTIIVYSLYREVSTLIFQYLDGNLLVFHCAKPLWIRFWTCLSVVYLSLPTVTRTRSYPSRSRTRIERVTHFIYLE